jgi:hypothetical protein
MMFVEKKLAIFIYKLVVICCLLVMFALFISATIETKNKIDEVDEIEKNETIIYPEQEAKVGQPCTVQYVAYFGLAIFLGAFINSKKLIKLGVI